MARHLVVPARRWDRMPACPRVTRFYSPDTWQPYPIKDHSKPLPRVFTIKARHLGSDSQSTPPSGGHHKVSCHNSIVVFGSFSTLVEWVDLGRCQIKALAPEWVFNWLLCVFLTSPLKSGELYPENIWTLTSGSFPKIEHLGSVNE